jgi:hypothetical protein
MAIRKHTPGPWTHSPMNGTFGHCLMAQVWDSQGKSLASIDSHYEQKQASANAKLIAAAPDFLDITLQFYEYLVSKGEQKSLIMKQVQLTLQKAL